MDIPIDNTPPSIAADKHGTIDFAKERELRELRAKVTTLTNQLAEYSLTPKVQLLSVPRSDEEHGYKCGYHPRVLVSMETASVTCEVCGAELSPLDVLREFANGERLLLQTMAHMRTEKIELAREVEQLKKQRASLRSQVRKKGGNVPPSPNATRVTQAEYYNLLERFNRLAREHAELKQKATP